MPHAGLDLELCFFLCGGEVPNGRITYIHNDNNKWNAKNHIYFLLPWTLGESIHVRSVR